jgi:hypothetical protein
MRMLSIRVVTICACWAYGWSKKYVKHWLSLRIVTYLIEYLGEFEFICETILDHESGDQMGSFDAKKPPSKISCLGTFKFKTFLQTYCAVDAYCILISSSSPPVCMLNSAVLISMYLYCMIIPASYCIFKRTCIPVNPLPTLSCSFVEAPLCPVSFIHALTY